ncbi:hypothetical protein SORBI_3001G293666 [Sorghum bicolor]|uniref:Uncharacterized protein n=1 Tax=Sorghum bicolor TaxID=4558 RepID=A0A1Z5S872_SORBI|nr:hypothetical protein SORBI_3001G293666 [Sorghum bicolor]
MDGRLNAICFDRHARESNACTKEGRGDAALSPPRQKRPRFHLQLGYNYKYYKARCCCEGKNPTACVVSRQNASNRQIVKEATSCKLMAGQTGRGISRSTGGQAGAANLTRNQSTIHVAGRGTF